MLHTRRSDGCRRLQATTTTIPVLLFLGLVLVAITATAVPLTPTSSHSRSRRSHTETQSDEVTISRSDLTSTNTKTDLLSPTKNTLTLTNERSMSDTITIEFTSTESASTSVTNERTMTVDSQTITSDTTLTLSDSFTFTGSLSSSRSFGMTGAHTQTFTTTDEDTLTDSLRPSRSLITQSLSGTVTFTSSETYSVGSETTSFTKEDTVERSVTVSPTSRRSASRSETQTASDSVSDDKQTRSSSTSFSHPQSSATLSSLSQSSTITPPPTATRSFSSSVSDADSRSRSMTVGTLSRDQSASPSPQQSLSVSQRTLSRSRYTYTLSETETKTQTITPPRTPTKTLSLSAEIDTVTQWQTETRSEPSLSSTTSASWSPQSTETVTEDVTQSESATWRSPSFTTTHEMTDTGSGTLSGTKPHFELPPNSTIVSAHIFRLTGASWIDLLRRNRTLVRNLAQRDIARTLDVPQSQIDVVYVGAGSLIVSFTFTRPFSANIPDTSVNSILTTQTNFPDLFHLYFVVGGFADSVFVTNATNVAPYVAPDWSCGDDCALIITVVGVPLVILVGSVACFFHCRSWCRQRKAKLRRRIVERQYRKRNHGRDPPKWFSSEPYFPTEEELAAAEDRLNNSMFDVTEEEERRARPKPPPTRRSASPWYGTVTDPTWPPITQLEDGETGEKQQALADHDKEEKEPPESTLLDYPPDVVIVPRSPSVSFAASPQATPRMPIIHGGSVTDPALTAQEATIVEIEEVDEEEQEGGGGSVFRLGNLFSKYFFKKKKAGGATTPRGAHNRRVVYQKGGGGGELEDGGEHRTERSGSIGDSRIINRPDGETGGGAAKANWFEESPEATVPLSQQNFMLYTGGTTVRSHEPQPRNAAAAVDLGPSRVEVPKWAREPEEDNDPRTESERRVAYVVSADDDDEWLFGNRTHVATEGGHLPASQPRQTNPSEQFHDFPLHKGVEEDDSLQKQKEASLSSPLDQEAYLPVFPLDSGGDDEEALPLLADFALPVSVAKSVATTTGERTPPRYGRSQSPWKFLDGRSQSPAEVEGQFLFHGIPSAAGGGAGGDAGGSDGSLQGSILLHNASLLQHSTDTAGPHTRDYGAGEEGGDHRRPAAQLFGVPESDLKPGVRPPPSTTLQQHQQQQQDSSEKPEHWTVDTDVPPPPRVPSRRWPTAMERQQQRNDNRHGPLGYAFVRQSGPPSARRAPPPVVPPLLSSNHKNATGGLANDVTEDNDAPPLSQQQPLAPTQPPPEQQQQFTTVGMTERRRSTSLDSAAEAGKDFMFVDTAGGSPNHSRSSSRRTTPRLRSGGATPRSERPSTPLTKRNMKEWGRQTTPPSTPGTTPRRHREAVELERRLQLLLTSGPQQHDERHELPAARVAESTTFRSRGDVEGHTTHAARGGGASAVSSPATSAGSSGGANAHLSPHRHPQSTERVEPERRQQQDEVAAAAPPSGPSPPKRPMPKAPPVKGAALMAGRKEMPAPPRHPPPPPPQSVVTQGGAAAGSTNHQRPPPPLNMAPPAPPRTRPS